MKYLRYSGEFLSRRGVTWRAEILQEAEGPYAQVGELTFDADEALTIEWPETSKEDTICGSTAVVRIISPGDRTYEDLYTVEPGKIRLDVYRAGALYWSGALDPEFYEEPYERQRNYTVELTFSDFGILERLKYNLTGVKTLRAILEDAIERSQINHLGIDCSTYATTTFGDGAQADLSALTVRSDNFTDEDGEQSNLQEALEGILQPLALRMVQRAGRIWLYDLNGLHASAPSRQVEWSGDSQTMGVDKAANNVKVTFSPYSSATLLDGETTYSGGYGPDRANFSEANPEDAEYGEYYTYLPEYYRQARVTAFDVHEASFSIFLGEGAGVEYLHPYAKYFHIEPLSGAKETNGIAWGLYGGGAKRYTSGVDNPGEAKLTILSASKGTSAVIYKSKRAFLPKIAAADQGKYLLRVSIEALIDARYNPYTDNASDDDGTGNDIDNYWDADTNVKERTGWAFIPVGITIYDADGLPLCHYDNHATAESGTSGIPGKAAGQWVAGSAGEFGDAWLEYYDPEDLKQNAGIRGWKANRQCIGRPDTAERKQGVWLMYDSFKKMEDGEYIPYPDRGGYIEVTLYDGVRCFDYGESGNFTQTQKWDAKMLYSKLRWLLYKAPKVEVVKNNLTFSDASSDDVEYSGQINVAAKDGIEIDTICGTTATTCPTAKGALSRLSTGEQIQTLTRAGVEDHPEKLLIGTLYSQYAERKTKLSGEAWLDGGALATYTERNQGGKKFLLTAQTQNCIEDTSETTIVELSPDQYEATNG